MARSTIELMKPAAPIWIAGLLMAAGLCSAANSESEWAVNGSSASAAVRVDVTAMFIAAGWADEAAPATRNVDGPFGRIRHGMNAFRSWAPREIRVTSDDAAGRVLSWTDAAAGWMECGLYAAVESDRAHGAAPYVGDASACSDLEVLLLASGRPVWPRVETIMTAASETSPPSGYASASWVLEPEIATSAVMVPTLAAATPSGGVTTEPLEAILPVMAMAFGGFIVLIPLLTMWLMTQAARSSDTAATAPAGRVSAASDESARRAA